MCVCCKQNAWSGTFIRKTWQKYGVFRRMRCATKNAVAKKSKRQRCYSIEFDLPFAKFKANFSIADFPIIDAKYKENNRMESR